MTLALGILQPLIQGVIEEKPAVLGSSEDGSGWCKEELRLGFGCSRVIQRIEPLASSSSLTQCIIELAEQTLTSTRNHHP